MSVPTVSAASTNTTVPTIPIPPEIISKIIDDLENMYFNEPCCEYMVFHQGDYGEQLGHFLACRLVSQTFMDIITPRVFEIEHNLGRHVRQLTYHDKDETGGNNTEPTVEATISNLHLFPNLDTAQIYFHVAGFLAADAAHAAAEEREKSDLQLQDLLQSESFPYRRELLVFFSLANSNFSIKHLDVAGVYLPPRMAKALTYSTSFIDFLSGLQTLEINTFPLSFTSELEFPKRSEFYPKFWNGFSILLPLATNVTTLSLTASSCTSGPSCETWDAMNLPHLTILELQFFEFQDQAAFGDINTGLLGFLQRHLQSGSRLSEVVLDHCRATYGSDIIWATVYDQIANLVSSMCSHSALKSFKHIPWYDGNYHFLDGRYFDHKEWRESQASLDSKAYERLQAVIPTV
ncbi:hypothetical protein M413DRAFT_32971 [Hebeloma cylindrosporum]|uniref:F-box domain-containing protein n=1 Tax=Hebeloma cylindrosporum TaxID=76867 RepID=A0A0C3BDG1_HEBCY|nr:hypothetical protein M413DRAFT_32971 [Hebeloma cylindrosporum h7]